MYGGILGALSVLGYTGKVRFFLAFLSEFTDTLQAENPKLNRFDAYCLALRKLSTEYVAN